MLSINLDDVMQVLTNVRSYLIAFGVVLALAIIVMVAVRKLPKAKNKMIRAQSGLAILLALTIVINLICTGPMSTMLDLVSGSGTINEETSAKATELVNEITAEGVVLAKDEDNVLPVASGSKLNVFGWSSTNPCYGGTGSGALNTAYPVTDLLTGLHDAGIETNEELSKFYTDYKADRPSVGMVAQDWTLPEPNVNLYTDEMMENAKAFSDTAMVVITRVGGEGADLPTDMASVVDGSWIRRVAQAYGSERGTAYYNGTYDDSLNEGNDWDKGDHFLQLSNREEDLLDLVTSNFDNVILVYNGANAFQMDFLKDYPQIKGVLLCPGTGQSGFEGFGKVVSGEAMVNQASITGEPLAVRKAEGGYVYAGTVVEEGDCTICVEKSAGSGRYDRIIRMIEESEKLKSATEDHASHLADQLVPYSLGATALVWLLTGNMTKALAVLMVDFSCALKLSMPIAVLSAMKEASDYHLSVKGGRFLEAVSDASTIVFDKTGTLTRAEPKVAQIVTFGGNDEADMLRLAACLEEHYPHSMAKAVVAEAARRGLRHEERHSCVEYLVAHGISSSVDGQKVVIGSHHFVFEDEHCVIPAGEQAKFDALPDTYSHLYLAVSGVLAAVICVEDPLRQEAADVIRSLRALGVSRLVMMTGDNEKTARAVAEAVGVDAYYAEVLPEDKAAFVRAEHAAGRKVIMLGDGVNDSPALSEADAGVAISDGAAIAREVADITVSADDLYALLTLKRLSDALMERIHSNYRKIISFNFLLICLGVAGVLPPATSALLHNVSTLAISLKSMTKLLP